LPNFRLPGDVSASQRYWSEDIVEPEIEVSAQGTITVSDAPGTGYAVKRDWIEKLTVRREMIRGKAASAI
jgi:o-succinylbenzoate synthase